MLNLNEKERLLSVLYGNRVDRPPVICPGGMMSACVTEMILDINENHNLDYKAMVEVSKKIHNLVGFENYGVPFSMIVEAEPFGVKIDSGNKQVEERVIQYSNKSIKEIMSNNVIIPREQYRMSVVLNAIEELKNDEVPVIGNITGHLSTATSVIDPLPVFKMMKREPELLLEFLSFINNYLVQYAKEIVNAGADVITISDPTATGEILGAKNFEIFAVPFYRRIIQEMHVLNVPVIVHICGNANSIIDGLNGIEANALSFDSIVSMRAAKAKINTNLMGNVSTQLLHSGNSEKISSIVKNCIDSGVDIVSPACGLSMATPIDNLKSMTDYVKRGFYD